MNVDGEGGEEGMKMEEKLVFMWGYLPGALPQRAPILSPVVVRLPCGENAWKDVCGGGCGFAMAISDSGKLITWGSTDDLGQSYVTSGKHGVMERYITFFTCNGFCNAFSITYLFTGIVKEMPEPFPLPSEVIIARGAAGWAHCVSVAVSGEVYTWGWKECVPSGKVIGDPSPGSNVDKEPMEKQSLTLSEQVSPCSHGSRFTGRSGSGTESRVNDDTSKRRRVSPARHSAENSSGEENLSALPCLVALNPGVRIASVAAGGRHSLALSDVGQVWGWGYGGEGQLGLGSQIRMVSSPHPVPCIDSSYNKGRSLGLSGGNMGSESQGFRVPGNYVKAIACGGRHSAVITDAGALLTFGWGLYGQCGQGSTDDELSPTCVSSLLGIKIEAVAAGLWHTICISADGDVYAFGGNQFGQLGTGADQAETLPQLLEAPSLENVNAKVVSCGARHSAVVTEDGKTFCWGWNKYGQLGLGDVIDRNIPCQVSMEGYVARNVACGWWHTLLLAESIT